MVSQDTPHKFVSLPRQVQSIESVIAILDGVKPKPKPSQLEYLLGDARAALETLRRMAER